MYCEKRTKVSICDKLAGWLFTTEIKYNNKSMKYTMLLKILGIFGRILLKQLHLLF